MSRPLRAVSWIAAGWLVFCRLAAAEPSLERSIASVLETGSSPSGFALDYAMGMPHDVEITVEDVQAAAVSAASAPVESYVPNPQPKRRSFWIVAASVATVAGSAYNSFTDSGGRSFHFTNENWFGRHTYAGGGDKVSHFADYYMVARLTGQVYGELGIPWDNNRLAGSLISALAGLTTEIGDGTNKYGFSYEDFVSDFAGAASAYVIGRYGLDDLLGFRLGWVPYTKVHGSPNGGTGQDYTEVIDAADVKICGLARRLHFNPGIARFLLVSTTYSAKGYPYALPENRERQVGLEVGLHISEILRELGLGTDRWWKRVLYVLVDSVRLPYTQIGVQFDLNHKKWRGPGIGDDFHGQP